MIQWLDYLPIPICPCFCFFLFIFNRMIWCDPNPLRMLLIFLSRILDTVAFVGLGRGEASNLFHVDGAGKDTVVIRRQAPQPKGHHVGVNLQLAGFFDFSDHVAIVS